MLEVGKLYNCEYFLLLYPDWDAAADAVAAAASVGAATAVGAAAADAAYWSKRLEKPVYYTEKNIPLLVLNNKKEYVEVLVEEKVGWIMVDDWLGIKEIVV